MLGTMIQNWHKILKLFDFSVVLDECVWATTLQDSIRQRLQVDGHVHRRVPRSDGFKVLGAQVSFDQSAAAALRRCFACAWAAFNKHKAVLCCRRASIVRRLHLLDRFVRPAALYAAGSLNLTRRQLRQVRGLHRNFLRKILGIQRPQEEPLEDYMRKVNDSVNFYFAKADIMWWDDCALKFTFTWAGHIARMRIYDSRRLVLGALLYRNREYLDFLEATHGHQCHGRRFHVWRWERAFSGKFGSQWMKLAIHSDTWVEQFPSWLSWRKQSFNAHRSFRNRSFKRFKLDLYSALACAVTDESSSSSTTGSDSS